MIFIIGGAYQGKTTFAQALLPEKETSVFTCSCDLSEVLPSDIVSHIEQLHLGMTRRGEDPLAFWKENYSRYSESILIADDISCGVVPIDHTERTWRENAGRANAFLAGKADQVYRVFCGLGVRLK